MNDPESPCEISPSVPNIPLLPEEARNSLSEAEKAQKGQVEIKRCRPSGKSSALGADDVGNNEGKRKASAASAESKSDLSQSVTISPASVTVKAGSVTRSAAGDNVTFAASRQSTFDTTTNASRCGHDTQANSEVRNLTEGRSQSEPMTNNNTKDETASGVPGKPNSQDTNKQSEGSKVPDNLSDSIARIVKGLDALLSLITEGNNDSENAQWCVNKTEKKKENLSRLLGIPEYQSSYTGTRDYDYTRKYPQDEFGKEAKENARVWKVYLDEAEAFDDEMLRGFRDTLDALLVFAALFSAVVTSFVIATIANLQPDYTEITARLMFEQNKLLRAAGNTTALQSVLQASVDLDNADISNKDLWVNGLFFASLSLSLATALLSVLVKQWLQAYNSSLPTGNACERAKIRQFRYLGFKQWKVPQIIGILPIILHVSLGLFMVGLSLYVSDLHQSLCWIVVSVTVIAFLMYFGTIIIPVIHIQCPYRVPILFALLHLLMFPLSIFQYFLTLVSYHGYRYYYHSQSSHLSNLPPPKWPSAPNTSLRHAETMFLQLIPSTFRDDYQLSSSSIQHHTMLAYCLKWLQSLQSNDSIQEVVHQTVHCIFHDTALKDSGGEIYGFQPALSCYETFLDWNPIAESMWSVLLRKDETDSHKICLSLNKHWRQAEKHLSHFPPWEPTDRLHNAARDGNLDIVKVFVENGADVNAGGGLYGFALQAAAYGGHLDIVKYLVEKGADVNSKGGVYGFAVQAAADRMDIVKYLVEKGADVNAEGGYYGFALQAAARWGYLEIVKYLVEKGAGINAEGGKHGSALQAAAYWGRLDVVKYFVQEKGVDVDAKGGEHGSALKAAQQSFISARAEIVKYLQEHGARE
ncbi:hypothetical protein D9758_010567 [Tetrapyrgos nigripes]|uniref:DUF6535 domain-containing protein n=1 Tax=Tetrapyrgos nigripes TaxID=182062 RepID=A0A8H5D7W7_9AGAR|nr:hypothetical protein D9758_010567 [Tetrapyrgos nigripes]